MPIRRSFLSRDFPRANLVDHKPQQLNFGIGNADHDAPIFVGVQAAERHCAFAVDESRNVGSDICWKLFGVPSLDHGESYIAGEKQAPRISPGNLHFWWRRRDSCSIPFETAWTMPSSFIACAMSRMRGVLSELLVPDPGADSAA